MGSPRIGRYNSGPNRDITTYFLTNHPYEEGDIIAEIPFLPFQVSYLHSHTFPVSFKAKLLRPRIRVDDRKHKFGPDVSPISPLSSSYFNPNRKQGTALSAVSEVDNSQVANSSQSVITDCTSLDLGKSCHQDLG
jgi:hypothetical protein